MSAQREWSPGDVGVTAKGRLALRRHGHPDGWVDSGGAPWSTRMFPSNVRPLVVIDPEDRGMIQEIVQRSNVYQPGEIIIPLVDKLQAALRSLIEPPKPPEPTGLGAVVEDDKGRLWIRDHFAADNCWFWAEPEDNGDWERSTWADLSVVKVLSGGIER